MRLIASASFCALLFTKVIACGQTLTKPDFFKTLVNPPCSHCIDESKRRVGELQPDDRVAAWIRGKYDGGAIPLRFFLVPYRVISDTYGVFVYDADAGFVRGFEPSLDFTFYGWHKGIMAIKDKDGTVYSALSGVAFDGPRRGSVLKPVPTLETDWGYWLKNYPGTVAYHMFEKHQAHDIPKSANTEALKTRPASDKRLPDEEMVIGLATPEGTRAYPLKLLSQQKVIRDKLGKQELVVLWYPPTRTAAIYAPRMENEKVPDRLKLEWNDQMREAPFMDKETFSHWNVEGRAVEGPLRGKALAWLPGVQCKWVAWSAEYPHTEVYSPPQTAAEEKPAPIVARLIEGDRLDWDRLFKSAARIQTMDAQGNHLTLLTPDQSLIALDVTPQSEIYARGWWGELSDFLPGQHVYVMGQTNGSGRMKVHALADEISIQAMSEPFKLIEWNKTEQKLVLEGPASSRRLVLHTSPASPGCVPESAQEGAFYYVNSRQVGQDRLPIILLSQPSFERQRGDRQQAQLASVRNEGFSATVVENERTRQQLGVLVRRAESVFARTLRPSDKVIASIAGQKTGAHNFTVIEVVPDYSRTRIRMAADAETMKHFEPGQQVSIHIELPKSLDLEKPCDLGRFTERQRRIDFFLSSIYCTCGMMGTSCAGHWNTLAACKLHGCGMPDLITRLVGEWIDNGKNDQQVLAALLDREGPLLLKQHQLGSPLLQ